MRFESTDNYVATEELKMAVEAAISLQKPLLIKGEPDKRFSLCFLQ